MYSQNVTSYNTPTYKVKDTCVAQTCVQSLLVQHIPNIVVYLHNLLLQAIYTSGSQKQEWLCPLYFYIEKAGKGLIKDPNKHLPRPLLLADKG